MRLVTPFAAAGEWTANAAVDFAEGTAEVASDVKDKVSGALDSINPF